MQNLGQCVRIGLYFVVTAFVVAFSLTGAQAAPYAAMVIDARTGEVLHSRNADTRLHPASLTKMMTLYIAFEAVENGEISLDTMVRISRNAASEPPSKLGLKSGQRIALRYLIRAAAVKSANDAATAIGEAIEGSEAAFARRMNRTAQALGMSRTTFKNANGLTEEGHLSTARDMTTLGRHLFYDYPDYYNLFSRRTTDAGMREVANTNRRLLNAYRGADGIKTGYTRAAGFNLVASATRGGHTLIAVVLGEMSSKGRAERAADLLEEGFASLETETFRPVLASMSPPEDHATEVTNVRATVCSQEANDARWANRSLDHFATEALQPLARALVPVPIFKGGAEGISKSAVLFAGQYFDELPVPAVRPVPLTDEVAELREQAGLAEGTIPIPQSRPDEGA